MKLPKLNTGYFKLIALLIIPFALLAMHASSERDIKVGGMTLEKCENPLLFGSSTAGEIVDTLPVANIPKIGVNEKDSLGADTLVKEEPDTLSHRILFFGDSMVEGLSRRMCEYAKENGHQLMNIIWYSSSTEIWSKSDTLQHFLRTFKPTYALVSIGGNELFVRDLAKREKYIQAIIKKLGNIPCVWIGPPNWKKDTGINDLIRKNMGADRFFLSKDLSFERASDHVHPTFASAVVWMDTIASWMRSQHCMHPIKMKQPTKREKCGKTIMLAPLN